MINLISSVAGWS